MEEDKILENLTKSISERLKVPIITTYLCVLVLYNWDIIFFLFFEKISASLKIKSIKEIYGPIYYERIFTCLGMSIVLIIIFTILNTFINFCLKWFYRKDKEITSEIESHEKVNILTEQLANSIEEIKKMKSKIDDLQKINQNLTAKNINVDISEISQKDYNSLIDFLNTKPNREKLIFSLKQLISELKKDSKIPVQMLNTKATYEQEMRQLLNHIFERHLAKAKRLTSSNGTSMYDGIELGASFKDFLKMEL